MATSAGIRDYRERLERVRRHIRANLDQPLNLDALADVACLSRFHWHRTYRGMTGETVWQTVRRLRLHRAAFELVSGATPIEEIAERSGYTNPRAFSQAFKADFGLPPLRYRAEGGHRRYDNADWQETEDMYDVRIENQEPVTIAGLVHTGPYIDVGATFDRSGSHLAVVGGWEKSAGMAAIYFSDPDITPPEELKSLAGIALKPGETPPEGLETCVLPAGRYAVLTHKGPYGELSKAYHWFFGPWLAESGETAGSAPAVERYLNTPLDTGPTELLTEIYMQLK
ncbi:AraC family transcriptional regulator [Hoeflea sp.]|uniref:AraC family transcriptional regulator n=1 Tax=Hoeflea sp. TaxID=1940281 RepID=UPI003B51A6DF